MDEQIEVFRNITASQEKYDYFLMSVAGAAIAFAIHRTTGNALNRPMVLLGFAVFLWATSFLAGIRRRNYIASNLFANFELLKVQSGTHPEIGNHPVKIAAAEKGINNACEYNTKRAEFWANVQLYSLIIGALFFIVWHIIDMSLQAKITAL